MTEQIKNMIQNVTSLDEIEELEKLVRETKDRIDSELKSNFWEGKKPCWEMSRCPDEVRDACPSFTQRYLPCWEIEGTYCKLNGNGVKGDGIEICRECRVYKGYGKREPIILKLFDKGFNSGK
ncbi:MAG: hypothetical protein JW712_08700 [Dehalococcoidales bacterium]|nr:hypothetical protein [Dehalococcoidales bacterium]